MAGHARTAREHHGMTYTVHIKPSETPGKLTATSSDGLTRTTSTPLLDGARYWQQAGAASSATIVTVWSSGSSHWTLRSTIGHASKLTVGVNHSRTPIFVRHKEEQ
jgi:hypothetical protein